MSNEEIVRKSIQVKSTLWNDFQKKIEEVYGTTYKKTGEAINIALTNYINERGTTGEDEKLKKNC